MAVQECRTVDLTTSKAQLRKVLTEARAHETELGAEVVTLQADLSTAQIRETTLQTSLNEARRVSDECLA